MANIEVGRTGKTRGGVAYKIIHVFQNRPSAQSLAFVTEVETPKQFTHLPESLPLGYRDDGLPNLPLHARIELTEMYGLKPDGMDIDFSDESDNGSATGAVN